MNDAPNANPQAQVPVEAPPVPTADHRPPTADPAPPPAAELVTTGTANEEAIQLRRELESERKARRDAELKASQAEKDKEDLLNLTRKEPATPLPEPAAPRRRRGFPTLLNHH